MAAAPGVCTTFFTQGCPHKCKNCQNPETWDFNGGKEFTQETLDKIISSINANGILRTFCVMGGEPLCESNTFLTELLIRTVKDTYPEIPIYIWTGYLYEDLVKNNNTHIQYILNTIDCLIDGPYIEEERDVTLQMRGSRNQRIIDLKKMRE